MIWLHFTPLLIENVKEIHLRWFIRVLRLDLSALHSMGRAFAGSHDDDYEEVEEEEEDIYDEDIDYWVSFETVVSQQGSGQFFWAIHTS